MARLTERNETPANAARLRVVFARLRVVLLEGRFPGQKERLIYQYDGMHYEPMEILPTVRWVEPRRSSLRQGHWPIVALSQ